DDRSLLLSIKNALGGAGENVLEFLRYGEIRGRQIGSNAWLSFRIGIKRPLWSNVRGGIGSALLQAGCRHGVRRQCRREEGKDYYDHTEREATERRHETGPRLVLRRAAAKVKRRPGETQKARPAMPPSPTESTIHKR